MSSALKVIEKEQTQGCEPGDMYTAESRIDTLLKSPYTFYVAGMKKSFSNMIDCERKLTDALRNLLIAAEEEGRSYSDESAKLIGVLQELRDNYAQDIIDNCTAQELIDAGLIGGN